MTLIYPVILKRSEESHKSLFQKSLRFFTSFRMTDKRKDVIGNPLIKEDFYLNGDDINLPSHSEAQRRISQVIANTEFEILHNASE